MIPQLVKDIKANRCILFLGPYVKTRKPVKGKDPIPGLDGWISHIDLYCQRLLLELQQTNIKFDTQSRNPYYLAGKFLDGSFEKYEKEQQIFKEIYDLDFDIFGDLAEIPFNTVVNFGADQVMNRALKRKGYDFKFKFYNYRGPKVMDLAVSPDMPLVYNLFGSMTEPDSVPKNEQEQLELMKAINGSRELPADLKIRMKGERQDAKSYIFLGFDFDEWPYRYFMDALGLPKASKAAVFPDERNAKVAIMTHDYYENRFGISFLPQDLESFVNDLKTAYQQETTLHKHAFIAFHEKDKPFFDRFKLFLETSKIVQQRNIQFFDQQEIVLGTIRSNKIKDNLNASTILIYLASVDSVADKDTQELVNIMLRRKLDQPQEDGKKEDILIFPVILKNCLWQTQFPELSANATLVMPGGDDQVYISLGGEVPDEEFVRLLEAINTRIR